VIKDPVAEAVHYLREREGVSEFEETPLTLEEVYTALQSGEEVLP